jgi:hypothetical protein
MSRERIYTSHHMDIAESLFTHGERTAISWSDRADIAEALTAAAKSGNDGYHTFDELYEHRHALFIALCRELIGFPIWRSRQHHDGSTYDGWFIMGICSLPGEQITYHLPERLWTEAFFATPLDRAPEWDGHTSEDVIRRLYVLARRRG